MQAATETGFIRKDEKTGEMIGTGEEGALGYLKWAAIHKADRFNFMAASPPLTRHQQLDA
jgi:hypothetical protein